MAAYLTDPITNQTIFTFLSEFHRPWKGQAVIEVFALTTIFLLALTGNCMVLAAVFRNVKLRTSTNILICNLATTDILFASGIPFIATTRLTQHWILGEVVCKAVTYVQFVTGICSITTMMVISVERYITVCLNKQYHWSRQHIRGILSVVWVIACAFPLPVAAAQTVQQISSNGMSYSFCGIEWWDGFNEAVYLGTMIILFFLIPLIVITNFYLQILKSVRRSMERSQCGQSRSEKSARKQIRLLKMFASIVVLFVVMWLPFFIISFLGVHYKQITSTHFTITLILALCNTCQNPILYGYFNYRFRAEFKNMCCKRFILRRPPGNAARSSDELQATELNSNGQNSSTA